MLQLKAYAWLIMTAVAAVGVAAVLWVTYTKGYDAADTHWQTKWNDLAADYMEENFQAQVKLREREAEWQRQFDEASKDAMDKINTLESDLAAASASADGLRDEARAYANRARKCAQTAGAIPERPPAEDTGLLLANLLDEAARAAGEYAEEADRRGIAGSACESAYLSLK